ncbi:ROK family transcriptional regulator [Deinococcus roseus]|uniref:Sugar kinase n=1 Tax=Deinococcus roseus TaxID=392414 RepID=A0ABQ2DI48_9DEIO|nr:ROK family transcriptional regulator [Deinococcus roseus]GGJ58474.1 sugar kinase [Deinococcus roseus]
MNQPPHSPKGDPQALRHHNRLEILRHLRTLGPTSRTDLVPHTGLSKATLTGLTAELIEEGLIVETSIGPSGALGGRKPVFLDINYTQFHAIGVRLSGQDLHLVLTDLSTRVLAHHTEPLQGTKPELVAQHVARLAQHLLSTHHVPQDHCIGMGIALAGVIDSSTGMVLFNSPLGWTGVPFAHLVSQHTELPTVIDNDINAFAASEMLFGHGKQSQNLLVIANGLGLGSALITGGKLYRGKNGGAGEFGHNTIQPGGRTCSCGRQGCLEAFVSEWGILQTFLENHPDQDSLTMDDMLKLAHTGDTGAQQVLQEAGQLLGFHLAHLVNVFAPEKIIFGGEAARFGPLFFDPLQHSLREHLFAPQTEPLSFHVVSWHQEQFTPWVVGAASLAVKRTFETGAWLHPQ